MVPKELAVGPNETSQSGVGPWDVFLMLDCFMKEICKHFHLR